MYDFFYRINGFTLYMLSISSGYRYVATMGVCVLVTLCWFFCLYQPLAASLAHYQQLCMNQKNDSHGRTKIEEEYTAVKQLLEKEEQHYQAKSVALKKNSLLIITNDLFNCIKKHDLIFESYHPDAITHDELFSYQPLVFELQGSFMALSSFFVEIAKSKYLLLCDTVCMRKIDNEMLACTVMFKGIQIKEGAIE